ncbi:MAG TPA: TetR/AcrR family transcriptional regulator [Steroidobacteraceae bacterium]|jgi:TetR/AcrR family transcriptional repressor of nem operon
MRYDAEHKQKTREKVLKAAAKAIRAEGPHRVGVAGVMAKAGLTHGGFYAHFDSKDDLVAAAIGQMFEDGRIRMQQETQEPDPATALASYIDFYLSPRHRDAVTGCPIPALATDLPRLARPARQRFSEGVSVLTAALSEKLLQMGRPNANEAASSLLAEMVGAVSLARAESDPGRSDAILDISRRSLKSRFGLPESA